MLTNRKTGGFGLAMLMASAMPSPAHAAPEDCATIDAAFAKMGSVPALHEAIEQDGTAFEATIIGDAMYMNMDGEITKLPMTLAKRQEMFTGLFDALAVKDCSPGADETINGRNMKVFDYTLPADGALVPEAIRQRVWIGADDGLPYQSTNPTGKVIITYEGVEAPSP